MRSLHGSLDLLILKSLSARPLHGVGVFKRIQQLTEGSIEVSYGSLFPALHRMEEKGLLKSQWNSSEHNRNAKYYELTSKGKKQLAVETDEWESIVKAVTTALRAR